MGGRGSASLTKFSKKSSMSSKRKRNLGKKEKIRRRDLPIGEFNAIESEFRRKYGSTKSTETAGQISTSDYVYNIYIFNSDKTWEIKYRRKYE